MSYYMDCAWWFFVGLLAFQILECVRYLAAVMKRDEKKDGYEVDQL